MQFDGDQWGAEDSVSLWEGIGGVLATGEGANARCGEDRRVGHALPVAANDSPGVVTETFPGFFDDGWTPPTVFGPRPVHGSGEDDGIGDDDEPFDDDDDDFFPGDDADDADDDDEGDEGDDDEDDLDDDLE